MTQHLTAVLRRGKPTIIRGLPDPITKIAPEWATEAEYEAWRVAHQHDVAVGYPPISVVMEEPPT